ncbi:hypothetical protein AYK24_04485 [Thermoplasmatales archaeon SG8-52-4]|nr:MAG: hypothetical protein AYK24_04485 [Thermoplasmatales archaeon SG8-52-4]
MGKKYINTLPINILEVVNIKKYNIYRFFIFIIVTLLVTSCFVPLSLTYSVNNTKKSCSFISEGQILFAPMQSTFTYLLESNKEINHTWPSSYTPGEAVYLLEDGSILRAIKLSLAGGGAGGGVQRITWEGDLIWDFRYNTDDYLSHHDIEPLPNGNILMIAWETMTRAEALDAGRDPNKLFGNYLWPDHVIEVEPTGPSSGDIVWEWHAWDHMIQDYDSDKKNYGVVEDHPELIDINFGSSTNDWMHSNSIDYHPEFDQIILSVHNFNEIWVIDHSTTTEEAAGHTGGNSGMGGDILYRWGNPRAYKRGSITDQKFFGQHDASWVEPGCPGEGNILVFNNGNGRPGVDYSSIDEIVPPVDESGNYEITIGEPFGPDEQIWIYNTDFYAWYIGGAQRMPNGNTLICTGPTGKILDVNYDKEIVWQYQNVYPNPSQSNIFDIKYYPPKEPPIPNHPNLDCYGNLKWKNVLAGEIVQGDFQVSNIGDTGSLLNWSIVSIPEWGNWTFGQMSGFGLTPEDSPLIVNVTVVAPDIEDKEFDGYIRIENQNDTEDYDIITVSLKTPKQKTKIFTIYDFLDNYIFSFPILKLLLQQIIR